MATLLNGKDLAEKIKREISKQLDSIGTTHTLAALLIGEDLSSKEYLRLKDKDCSEVGINFENFRLPSDSSLEEAIDLINQINQEKRFDGIIVQLPIPNHFDQNKILKTINPEKDVDGLHPYNIGKLWVSDYDLQNDLLPCTPKGIIRLLDWYKISLEGENVVIINRSNLVGKPLSKLMLDRDATVTICHSKTRNLKDLSSRADILVSAVGRRPDFTITEDMVAEGAVVVDVGISHLEEDIRGDVMFEEVREKASCITPVPGGVGPMTRAMLLENVLIAKRKRVSN